MKLKEAIKLAKEYSKDFVIQHAGVTKDNCVVTTLECVKYQQEQGELKIHYHKGKKVKP